MKQKILTIGLVMFFTLFIKADILDNDIPLYQITKITKEELIIKILKNQNYMIEKFNSIKMQEKLITKFYLRSIIFSETKEFKEFTRNWESYMSKCNQPYKNIFTKEFKQQTEEELTNLTKEKLEILLSLFIKKSNLTTNIMLSCIQSYSIAKNSFDKIKEVDKRAIQIQESIMSTYHRMSQEEINEATSTIH